MTYTRAIGIGAGKIIRLIVRGLALSRINPNVLTFLRPLVNIVAACLLGHRAIPDGRARDHHFRRVVRYGGRQRGARNQPGDSFRRHSSIPCSTAIRIWLCSIGFARILRNHKSARVRCIDCNRHDSVRHDQLHPHAAPKISFQPARWDFWSGRNGWCLLIIGALFDRMAPVLWVIAILGNITVIHRMFFTWQEARRLEQAQLRPETPDQRQPLRARATHL